MRTCYIVCYDIADERRLRHVEKVMEAQGQRIQYSVFRCELTEMKLARLRELLAREINQKEDQVLFISLGPVPGRGEECITALGQPYIGPERGAVVF
jgi:CRISPR-associated protein Cas2